MDTLISLLTSLNALTPLGLAGLLALILFYQSRNNRASVAARDTLETIRTNDLHLIPDILLALQRIETAQSAAFATLIALTTAAAAAATVNRRDPHA